MPRGQKEAGSKQQNACQNWWGSQPVTPERTLDMLLSTLAPTTPRTLSTTSSWSRSASGANGEDFPQRCRGLHVHSPHKQLVYTSHSWYTQAIEDTNQMLSNMYSSYLFVYLLERIFSTKQPRQMQFFSDVVHLNQGGLAILLRRIVSFLPRSQRQVPHKNQALRQRPGRDQVNSGGDADVQILESAS